jgi:hypothetical protein
MYAEGVRIAENVVEFFCMCSSVHYRQPNVSACHKEKTGLRLSDTLQNRKLAANARALFALILTPGSSVAPT